MEEISCLRKVDSIFQTLKIMCAIYGPKFLLVSLKSCIEECQNVFVSVLNHLAIQFLGIVLIMLKVKILVF